MKLANHFQSSLCKMMSGVFCKICKWMVLNALLMSTSTMQEGV